MRRQGPGFIHPNGCHHPSLISPSAILLAAAGANNAGVSTVIETFGVRGDAPSSIARVEEPGE